MTTPDASDPIAIVNDPGGSPETQKITHSNFFKFADAEGLKDDAGNEVLTVTKTTTAVNEVNVTNAATGNAPKIAPTGDDTNIDLNLAGKGTGDISITGASIKLDDAEGIDDSNGNEQIVFQETASAVNEFEVTNAATAGAPKLAVTGDDTNIDMNLLPKGTGVLNVSGTTDYETNVTDDDDIPNKKYVDDNSGGTNTVLFGGYIDLFNISTTTQYLPVLAGNSTPATTEARVKGALPAGTVKNLRAFFGGHPGGTITVTFREDGADSTLTLDATGTGLTEDTSNTVAITTASDCNFSIVGTAGSTGAMFVVITCELEKS